MFVAVGVAVIVVQPLLSPRLEPVRRPRGRPAGRASSRPARACRGREVEVRRTRGRTRLLNAEALGIGPTTRVMLWESTLALPAAERAFLVAHELAHVQRKHLWKGLAWFVLLGRRRRSRCSPRLAPLRAPEDVPRALLIAFVLLLVATPIANAVSRRYEAEADWVGLETTRDPEGAKRFFADLAEAGVRDPSPPRWWTLAVRNAPDAAPERRRASADASASARSRAGS